MSDAEQDFRQAYQQVRDVVVGAIANDLCVDPGKVRLNRSLSEDEPEGLGMDSLARVELIMSIEDGLEELFGEKFKISDEDAQKIDNAGDAIRFVLKERGFTAGGSTADAIEAEDSGTGPTSEQPAVSDDQSTEVDGEPADTGDTGTPEVVAD
jgi:acyl carrier protein